MKRLISTLLAAILTASISVPAFAATDVAADKPVFSDVKADTVQGEAILKMYDKGYLAGYEDGTFRPDGSVTRAELVRIINQVFGFSVNDKLNTADFSDNANKAAWFYNDVRIAQQMGYISGFGDNSFRPRDNFTRQQACVVLTLLTNAPENAPSVEISDSIAPWANKYVNSAVAAGLFELEENNTFRATQNITRGELCVALVNFVKEDTETTTKVEATTETTTATNKADAETTTKKSSVSVSGGGGGGGSKTTTSATTTTKETTTEATTASSKDDNKTTTATTAATTTTEATTEITTAAVEVDADLITSIKRTVRNITRYVEPNCSTDAQKEVANAIADAMNNFMSDYSYDVEGAANDAMDKYRSLSASEKDELKKLIIGYCAMSDLVKLRDTFFPGLTY